MTEKNPRRSTRIAILATDGFEESELLKPRETLRQAGAETVVVSLKKGEIKAWAKDDWGKSVKVDLVASDADAADFDALLLPGGVMNPDKLRMDPTAVAFVREFADAGKIIAAICHGPWTLVEADLVQGRTLTSWPSIKTDLINAGANWVDKEVVSDQGLITSRKPGDIPAFTSKLIEELRGKPSTRAA